MVSHAHLDHCGYLPRLWRQGYRGPIYLTPDTANLASIVLRDSAHLQEEDAKYARKKGYSRHAHPEPLYDSSDAEGAISLFRPREFLPLARTARGWAGEVPTRRAHPRSGLLSTWTSPGPKFSTRATSARVNTPYWWGPHTIPAVEYDAILTESTYGTRVHPPADDSLDGIISQTISRGGTVLIPAFAVDRTEVILTALTESMDAGRIPRVPIYVDSPMAIESACGVSARD